MTAAVLYTDTDAIRACVGVDANDVEDTIITYQGMVDEMSLRLDILFPTHATATGDDAKRLALWCQYYAAYHLLTSGRLSIPFLLSTGKDEYRRFQVDFDQIVKAIAAKLRGVQADLSGESVATAAILSMVSKATPSYDPTTGESV